MIMVFLQENVGASMWKPPSQGSEFDWSSCKYKEKHHYEVEPLGVCRIFERNRSWLYVCKIPFHMNETSEQNRHHYFEEVTFSFQGKCHAQNWAGSLNFIKRRISFFHILYVSALKGRPCLQGNCFEQVKSFLKNGHTQKHNRKAELLTWGNIIKADCNL